MPLLQRTWLEIWSTLRVHHALGCLSSFYGTCRFPRGSGVHGGLSAPALDGLPVALRDLGTCTAERGVFFFTNEQGADVGVIWDAPGAIGLVFDKDSRRYGPAGAGVSPSEPRPLRWLDGLPEELTELGRVLASLMGEPATAGFWLAPGGASWLSTGNSVDTHDWFNLLNGPRGPLQDLEELSLDAAHGELAVALAMRSLSAPTELSLGELETLRTLPTAWADDDYPRDAFEPTPEALAALRVQLARIDVLLKI